ncbi:Prolyl oligopeptidase [Gracilaria domingensis]|nr:Prolyl oligopeptidase [Gracilaria domingensis]
MSPQTRAVAFVPASLARTLRRSSFASPHRAPVKSPRPSVFQRGANIRAVLRQPPNPTNRTVQSKPRPPRISPPARTDAESEFEDSENVYQLPPPEIARLVDASADPYVSLQPSSKKWIVMLQRPNMPPIAEVAAEELRLAGYRINANTYAPSRADYFIGMALQRIDDSERKQFPVTGLPPAPGNSPHIELGYVRWAPDGSKFSFCVYDPLFGLELWVLDVATRHAVPVLPGVRLNAVCGEPYTWSPDSKTIIAKFVVEDRLPPQKSRVPKGPLVQENLSSHPAPSRTYQDLLKSRHDVALFEHYTTCQLGAVDVEACEMYPLGEPAAFKHASPSPDGSYLLVDSMVPPYHYMMPAGRFPRKVEVWNAKTGDVACVVAEIPSQDKIPIAFDGVGEGPRSIGWRADAPAMLYWAEAQDGGDPNREADIRDCLFSLSAPFTGRPRRLASLQWRYAGIIWGSDSVALVSERRYRTRSVRSYLMAPGSVTSALAPGEDACVLGQFESNGASPSFKSNGSQPYVATQNGAPDGNGSSNGVAQLNNSGNGVAEEIGSDMTKSKLTGSGTNISGENGVVEPHEQNGFEDYDLSGPCCARACDLSQWEAPKRRIIDIKNWEDVYNDPGSICTTRNSYGKSVLRLIYPTGRTEHIEEDETGKPFLMMLGAGASDEGDKPFLSLFDTVSGKQTRVWQSSPPKFESIATVLKEDESTSAPLEVLIRQETPKENPNYFVKNVSGAVQQVFTELAEEGDEVAHVVDTSNADSALRAVTKFPHPAPDLVGVQREIVQYDRADGVRLNGSLYLPPGYDQSRDGPLPVFIWAYPREYKSAEFAGQTRGSPFRFVRLARTPLYWLTRGYAILDGPEMPIIGEGDAEANDTYVEQLVSSAEAAVDFLVKRGVGQRGRIAIGGHSYGAFMTVNLLAHAPNLFCCGIARSGAYNRTLTPFGFQSEERSLWQARDVYQNMSPYMYANKVGSPLLLIHGEADNNPGTFPMQSERMYQALKGHGKVTRYVLLPHEGHGYRARESVMHVLSEMTAWLDKYCKKEQRDNEGVSDS